MHEDDRRRVAVALAAVLKARVAVAVVAADPAVVLGADVGVAAPPPQAASKPTSPPPGRPRQAPRRSNSRRDSDTSTRPPASGIATPVLLCHTRVQRGAES